MAIPIAVGIDLGTTYCAVGVVNHTGQLKMLPNRDGQILTPSFVELDADRNAIVGEIARIQANSNQTGVASEFKVKMGDPSGRMQFAGHEYDATLLSAYLLARLKKDAELSLSTIVEHAVITVPAYFGHLERLATKRAAEIAGFNVLRLVNEPTAAAIDHAVSGTQISSGILLVFDLGGGTLDATILRVEMGHYAVVATKGDHDLGGLDWDEMIVARIANAFLKQHGKNVRDDMRIMFEVKQKAEQFKRALTRRPEVSVYVSAGANSVEFALTREHFEEDCEALLWRCELLVNDLLKSSDMTSSEIDEVLLVGGATRMPMVQAVMKRFFACDVRLSSNPDEAVARGAAVVANREMLIRNLLAPPSERLEAPEIVDITSHSLGEVVVVKGNAVARSGATPTYRNKIIIPRWTALPATMENVTCAPRGARLLVTTVTEGETADPDDCVILSSFDMDLGRAAEHGDTIVTTYNYDISGILTARVTDMRTGLTIDERIDPPSGTSPQAVLEATKLFESVRID